MHDKARQNRVQQSTGGTNRYISIMLCMLEAAILQGKSDN